MPHSGNYQTVKQSTRNVSRMPAWIRQHLGNGKQFGNTSRVVQQYRLHTVCEEARCPNRGECWARGTATFMLLGDTCTRSCGFCSVKTGRPAGLDTNEPLRIKAAVEQLALDYVVLTSVNRDDLNDGGAGIFAETISQLWHSNPQLGIELLTPDFQQDQTAATTRIGAIVQQHSERYNEQQLVWGHNMETVPRLYRLARKGSRYERSLSLLQQAATGAHIETKSALMLGLGETENEVLQVLQDLRSVGVSRIALGQYLRPTLQHLAVHTYVHPTVFADYAEAARGLGFTWVKAGALVRSSYHAEEQQGVRCG